VKAWKSQTSISDLDFEFDPTSFNHMLGSIIDLVDEAGLFDNLKTSNQLIFSSDIVTQSSLEFQEYIKDLLINKLMILIKNINFIKLKNVFNINKS